jgi:hypothetical protein
MQTRRFLSLLMIAAVGLFVVGCGGPKRGTVAGKVTFQGSPVSKGIVTLYNPATGDAAQGQLAAGGAYELKHAEGGLLPGEYKVTVAPLMVVDVASGREGMEVPRMVPDGGEDIPDIYRSEATTPLSATVKPGGNQHSFELEP